MKAIFKRKRTKNPNIVTNFGEDLNLLISTIYIKIVRRVVNEIN